MAPFKSQKCYSISKSASDHKDDQDQKAAVKKLKLTSEQWVTLATLAFGNFSAGACASLQAPFFPAEAEKKGATPTEYGLIFGVYQLTVFLTAPLMGKLVPYATPKYLLNAGVFAIGVACVLFGTLDMVATRSAFVALSFIVRAVEGIGVAAFKTAMFTIIASQFSDNLGTTFATLEAFLGVGLIIGPTLGGALYDYGGYGLPFYVMGSIILFDAVIIFFVLVNIENKSEKRSGGIIKFLMNPGILIYAFSVFTTFNFIGFNSVSLEPHLRELHLSGLYLGMLFALSGTLYALSSPIWGRLTDKKVDRKMLSAVGCLICVVSFLLIGPAPFFQMEINLVTVILALCLLGIGGGAKLVCAFSGSAQEAIERGFPADLHTYGLVSSMFASTQSLGAFMGPSLGGYLLETVRYKNATMIFFGMELLLMTFLVLFLTMRCAFKKHSATSDDFTGTQKITLNGCIISQSTYAEENVIPTKDVTIT